MCARQFGIRSTKQRPNDDEKLQRQKRMTSRSEPFNFQAEIRKKKHNAIQQW